MAAERCLVEGRLAGSAFVIADDGVALASRVRGPGPLEAFLADGRRVEAVVLGVDERYDVMVIRLRGEDLPGKLPLAPEVPPVGTFVVAVGNPNGPRAGNGPLLTVGIVGARNREDRRFGALHTDAAVNRGNYGGPLLDIEGRVVGILSSLSGGSRLEVGENSGVGYAIPVSLLACRVERLQEGVDLPYRPGYLGITIDLDATAGGVTVETVREGYAADRAGIRPGDVIVAVDGEVVAGIEGARRIFSDLLAGRKARFEVIRKERRLVLPVVPGRRPR